jgi:hypothetical protein
MATWELHYLENHNAEAERWSTHDTGEAALRSACAIRDRHYILYIKGPGKNERIERDEIVAWCVAAKF